MAQIISFLKLLIQVYGIVKSVVDQWNNYQKEKARQEADEKASRRKQIEKELQNENLTSDQKRKLLSDLNRNSF